MDKLLAIACFFMAAAMVILAFPDGAIATVVTLAASLIAIYLIRFHRDQDGNFLVRVFVLALLARLALGLFIHVFELRSFFGGDALTYDSFGAALADRWFGVQSQVPDFWLDSRLRSVGWGMYYLIASIYSATGRSPLTAQSLCAVIGAATAPLIYVCAYKIFHNRRVSKISAVAVALYPAFIVWSGQLLKDGLIVFLLVLSMTMVLKLRERFSYLALFTLLLSLAGIFSLRSYIFYMVAVAIVGMFVIGFVDSQRSLIASFLVLIALGTAFSYLGAFNPASADIQKYTNLQQVQLSRLDLSRAGSGFGDEIDVSTTRGAIQAIPVGFVYLMFAPFPWEIGTFRQAVAVPDILIWWMSLPLIISGLIYSIRNRLRGSLGIIIFTGMLSLAYSIFQGNVGTAYRQRTQIQVFLFIFAAVGATIWIEKRENKRLIREARRTHPVIRQADA